MFFDYDGNPIDAVEWSRLLEDARQKWAAPGQVVSQHRDRQATRRKGASNRARPPRPGKIAAPSVSQPVGNRFTRPARTPDRAPSAGHGSDG